MSENTENKDTDYDEKPPGEKKQIQLYVALIIVLLVVALIFDTFRRAGNDKEQASDIQTYEEPIRQQKGQRDDFERRMAQEHNRRKIKKEFPQVEETPEETLARLKKDQKRKEQPPIQPVSQPTNEIDIYQEFYDSEKKRALNARRSGFNLKKTAAATTGIRPIIKKPGTSFSKPRSLSAIEAEKKRVMQEIQRLNGLQGKSSLSKNNSFGSPGDMHSSSDQNNTTRQAKSSGRDISNDAMSDLTVGQPASKGGPKPGQKLIPTATVINAVLDQTLMSDYAGSYRGMITHDVYDVTRTSILIPKGSRFTGDCFRISNINEPIQARMGLSVKWVVLPNGKRIDLTKRGDMLDQEGIHAVKDKVNYHFIAQFLGVAAYALISTETSTEGTGIANDVTYEGQVGQSMREQFSPMAEKYLDLVPTITLRAGTPIKIFLEDDVYAHEWSSLRNRLINANRASY